MSLHNIGAQHGTDKSYVHHFLDFYEQKLGHLQNEPIKLLEIGYGSGGSIKMWLDYFPLAEIHCVDKIQIGFEHERFKAYQANQVDFILPDLFENNYFDIILDDGSHMTSHQFITLFMLWKKLKPKGFYILEDLHTSFMDSYIDTKYTPYQWLTSELNGKIERYKQKNFENIDLYHRVENLLDSTNSITSIITKTSSYTVKYNLKRHKLL